MKLSEYWLREWVNPSISSKSLSEQMTMAGIEVSDIKPVPSQFRGILVGEIVYSAPHPNTNKFMVTKVNVGLKHLLNIVSEAINCCQGLKVAVATVDAVLANKFKIKAIRIFGELSEGMLCSYVDLGISSDDLGIIELPHDAPIGIDIRNYLQFDDHIFELTFPSNRADCLSVLGIARDIAAINNLPLKMVEIKPVQGNDITSFPIRVEEPILCPHFLGRVIKGINTKVQTPIFMLEKLRRGGIHAVNPVVDIINFVLLELGQPLHAYDFDNLSKMIIVRMANPYEELILFDGSKVILGRDTLVVADEEGVLGIAGIFYGKRSSINKNSINIFLESAFYEPFAIVGRARNYGLRSESSQRFERGVDPQLQCKAMERATRLIIEVCGGEVGNIINIGHKTRLPKAVSITLTRRKLDRLIGYSIPDINVTQILQRLGFRVNFEHNVWKVVAPSWRFDMKIEEDLIKEVIRIYGYNNVPNVSLNSNLIAYPRCESVLPLKRIKMLLIDRGYNEVVTYSFVDPKIQKLLHPSSDAIMLSDPVSSEMSVMRVSLLPGLLKTLVYNQNRQQNRIRLFETGLRFIPDESAEHGIRQELVLGGVITGNRYEENWLHEKRKVDFFDIKGDVEAILELTGKLDDIVYKDQFESSFHPGQSARIYLKNNFIGYFGVIHPALENKLDLHGRVLVFELVYNSFSECVIPKLTRISHFPANRRDIAIVVPKEVSIRDVLDECKKNTMNHIVELNLFDVYCGQGIPEGYKSLAISLILQDVNRTLEEEEISAIVNKCIAALKNRFQASLRD